MEINLKKFLFQKLLPVHLTTILVLGLIEFLLTGFSLPDLLLLIFISFSLVAQFLIFQKQAESVLMHFIFTVQLILYLLNGFSSPHNTYSWLFITSFLYQVVLLVHNVIVNLAYLFAGLIVFGVIAYVQHDFSENFYGLIIWYSLLAIMSHFVLYYTIELSGRITLKEKISKQIHQQLANQLLLYKQIIEANNGGILATDEKGNILEVNQELTQLLGFSHDFLKRASWLNLVDEGSIDCLKNEINERYQIKLTNPIDVLTFKAKIGSAGTETIRYKTSENKTLVADQTVTLLKDESQKTIGYSILIRDKTELVTAAEKQYMAEAIVNNSPAVLFRWLPDRHWSVSYVSSNIKRILGYNTLDFTTHKIPYSGLIHPDDINNVSNVTTEALFKQETQLLIEYRILHANGHYIWVKEQSYINRNDFGEVTFFEGVITDVTIRKEAEIKLKESELRYDLAVQGISAGIWDWQDVNSNVAWWSPKFYELLGYEFNELPPTSDSFQSLIHPDDYQKTIDVLQNHFEHNQPYMIEHRFKTKSGKYKWFLGNGKVFRDELGRPQRMVGSLIDIHERKMRELALVDNEKHFRELVERAVDIFFKTDKNGLFVYMNDAAVHVTGFYKVELEGSYFTVLVHPDYRLKVLRFYLNQFKNKIPLTYYEFPIVTKDGQVRWIGQNLQINLTDGVLTEAQAIARYLPNYA